MPSRPRHPSADSWLEGSGRRRLFPRLPRTPRPYAPALAVVVALLALVLPGSYPVATASRLGPVPIPSGSGTTPGSGMLHQAEVTLREGQGPAAGASLRCSSGPSPRCGPLGGSPAPTTSPAYWLNLSDPRNGPSPRETVAMTYDAADGYVLLFGGGQFFSGNSLNDTWTFSGGTWTQRYMYVAPPVRLGAGMVYDAADGYVVLFGGLSLWSGATFLNDTWTYSAGIWNDVTPSISPTPRWAMGMTYDARDGYVLLFGGEGSQFTEYQSDTWTYLARSWSLRATSSSPSARAESDMGYDASGQNVLLYSGEAGAGAFNDTWDYSNGSWRNLTGTLGLQPIAEVGDPLVYDPVYSGMVLQESSRNRGGPTFVFSLGAWKLLPTHLSPPGRYHMKGVYDPPDQYLVEFGGAVFGNPSATTNGTWALAPVPRVVALVSSPPEVDVNQSIRLSVRLAPPAPGSAFTFHGLPPGCASSNTTALPCTPNTAGSYAVNVTETPLLGTPVTSPNLTILVDPRPTVKSLNFTPPVTDLGLSVNVSTLGASGKGPLTFTYHGLPRGCPSLNVSRLTCRLANWGNFTVTVVVGDVRHGEASVSQTLRVHDALALAPFTVSPSTTVDRLETIHFTSAPQGGTPPVVFSYGGLPPGCNSVDQPNLTCAPTGTGVFNVTLNESDSLGDRISALVRLFVSPDPVLGPLRVEPARLDVGSTISLSAVLSLGSGPYSVAWSGLPPGCPADAGLSFSCVPAAAGDYRVEVVVTDAGNFSRSSSANVSIAAALGIDSVDYPQGGWDVGRPFSVSVTTAGGTAPLTYRLTGPGSIATCRPQAAPNASVCTPTAPGTFGFRETVTDLLGRNVSVSHTFEIHPALELSGFLSPQASTSAPGPFNFSYAIAGGTVPYRTQLSGFPGLCQASTLGLGYSCERLRPGTYEVTLTVTDSVGGNASLVAALQVSPATAEPASFVPALDGADLAVIGVAAIAAVGVIAYLQWGRARGTRPVMDPARTDPIDAEFEVVPPR
ncbi:MAG: hypothetical protein L3K19_07090 [Thermoplasmata archaeon]|nr:hypothetical protein [Thermoplasmata archaeon]